MKQDDRPDPVSGRKASLDYAEHYAQAHRSVSGNDFQYRSGYLYLLTLDALLFDYRLLDVGCGTGGFYSLLNRYRSITAIDFSDTMINAALALKYELELDRVDFLCIRFEDFYADEPFDAISLSGVYGWYEPWVKNEKVLYKANSMLSDTGLCVVSCVFPTTITQWIKALLFPRKSVVIAERKFLKMAKKAGFRRVFSVKLADVHSTYIILQKINT